MFICDNIKVNERGNISFADLDVTELAKKYGTPLYLLDENKIRENCRTYINALAKYFPHGSLPLFASKALSFKKIYEIVGSEKMGIDVVSSGELYTALKAGFDVSHAYFHGNNKTDFDIAYGMDSGIGYFVVDNRDELDAINREAKQRGKVQKILVRLSPGIDPHTHKAIVTGSVDSKFGVAIETGQAVEFVKYALSLENIDLRGFHCHIGSQIFEAEPFIDASKIMLRFISDVKNAYGYETDELNLGGGFAVRYLDSHPTIDIEENVRLISLAVNGECKALGIKIPKILMEPGRSIVADAGMTLYTVGGTKEIPGFKNYVSVDGGMPDNPRYALYESPYTAIIANKAERERDFDCTIAGRCCESGDLLQEKVKLQKAERGDILAVFTTGAYNYSMASNYNRLTRPPIIVIKDRVDSIAVKRESFEDLTKNEI